MNEKQQIPKRVSIPTELAEEILKYLAKRPIDEAVDMWHQLRQAEPIAEQVKEDD